VLFYLHSICTIFKALFFQKNYLIIQKHVIFLLTNKILTNRVELRIPNMKEAQNIEWKENWRDEYIKWICGFANADGGTLYIGKDDNGDIKGIADAAKLLNDIPNKIRDVLGIIVDVNLRSEKGKDYLEINVASHPYPISYKGQYHYRSGSTKQELKGASLDRFLLQKQAKHWDDVTVPSVTVQDWEKEAITLFKNKASKSGRLSDEAIGSTPEILIENLRLKDGAYLKRAALLLFYSDPEKYVTGAYIKIGFFESEAELLYQDEIHGTLIEQADKAMDLLYTKYLKAYIRYEGINRVEQFLFPKEAVREALLNSIVHKDYASSIPIQIRIYEDKIIIWNEGELPENWTVETLRKSHPSKPFNPDIANVFFRAGLIESWGRGIEKIETECKNIGLPPPKYDYSSSSFKIEINAKSAFEQIKVQHDFSSDAKDDITSGANGGANGGAKYLTDRQNEVLDLIKQNPRIAYRELAEKLGINNSAAQGHIKALKSKGVIERDGGTRGYWKIISKTKKNTDT